jgi:hypothetical protein
MDFYFYQHDQYFIRIYMGLFIIFIKKGTFLAIITIFLFIIIFFIFLISFFKNYYLKSKLKKINELVIEDNLKINSNINYRMELSNDFEKNYFIVNDITLLIKIYSH